MDLLTGVHVLSGAFSLMIGIVPLLTKKGRRLHRQSGSMFTIGMTIVFLTAMPMSVLSSNAFLFCIGIFSQYLVYSGYRSTKWKRTEHINFADYAVCIIAILIALGMIALAAIEFIKNGRLSTFVILLFAFGIASLIFPISDLRFFQFRENRHQNHWLHRHVVRMMGAYIAAFTAFLVNNFQSDYPLLLWLGPGIIGGIIIHFTIRYHKLAR